MVTYHTVRQQASIVLLGQAKARISILPFLVYAGKVQAVQMLCIATCTCSLQLLVSSRGY